MDRVGLAGLSDQRPGQSAPHGSSADLRPPVRAVYAGRASPARTTSMRPTSRIKRLPSRRARQTGQGTALRVRMASEPLPLNNSHSTRARKRLRTAADGRGIGPHHPSSLLPTIGRAARPAPGRTRRHLLSRRGYDLGGQRHHRQEHPEGPRCAGGRGSLRAQADRTQRSGRRRSGTAVSPRAGQW